MSLVSHIADRFLLSRGSRLLSVISLLAALAISVGVTVVNLTLAVMNGFRDEVQVKFVENMPMVTVMSARGFGDLEQVVVDLGEDEDVLGAAPFLRSEIIVTHQPVAGRTVNRGAVLWGVDAERQSRVTRFEESVSPPFSGFGTEGMMYGGPEVPGIVLGVELASELRAGVGDRIAVHAPRKSGPGADDYETKSRECLVVGLLKSGLYEFDAAFAYLDLAVVQDLLLRPGQADGIGLRVTDMMRAPMIADRLEDELGGFPYYSNDWIGLNAELFRWIKFEKALMFLVVSLLIVVASINIISLVITMVRDRSREIAILSAMGARSKDIIAIFLRLGMAVGGAGTVLGTAFGLFWCWLLDWYGFPLPGEVLFVAELPVHPSPIDFAIVGGVALVLTFLASLVPAWMASRVLPVEVLRHE